MQCARGKALINDYMYAVLEKAKIGKIMIAIQIVPDILDVWHRNCPVLII